MADVNVETRPQSPALSIDVPLLAGLFEEPSTPSTPVPPRKALRSKSHCAICKKHHLLRFCRRFRGMDLEHRLRAVVKHGYCMKCFSSQHVSSKCISSKTCGKCNGGHHYMLHDDGSKSQGSKKIRQERPLSLTSASLRNSVRPIYSRAPTSPLIFPTCQLLIWVHGQPIAVRALLDQCCGMNYILQQFSSARGLIRIPASDGQDVQLIISSRNSSSQRTSIAARVTRQLLRPTTTVPLSPSLRAHFEHLHLADPEFDQPGPLHMVLGMPVYNTIMRLNVLSQPGYPQAQDSIFGWVLSGSCSF